MKSLGYLLSFEKSDISIFQPTQKLQVVHLNLSNLNQLCNLQCPSCATKSQNPTKQVDCFRIDSSYNQHVWIKYDHLIFPKGFHSQSEVLLMEEILHQLIW